MGHMLTAHTGNAYRKWLQNVFRGCFRSLALIKCFAEKNALRTDASKKLSPAKSDGWKSQQTLPVQSCPFLRLLATKIRKDVEPTFN
jgi:hypothetical protein